MPRKKKLSVKKSSKQRIQAEDFKNKISAEVNELIKSENTSISHDNLTNQKKIWRESLLKEISQSERELEDKNKFDSGNNLSARLTQTPEVKSTGTNPDLVARWRQRQRRKKYWLLIPVLIVLILVSYNIFRLDRYWPQAAAYLPWPAAIINNQIVWAHELNQETFFVKKFYNVPEAESIAFNHLLEERLISASLRNFNLYLTNEAVGQEISYLASDFGSEQIFYDYLHQAFNIKPEELTNRMLEPYLKRRLLHNYLARDPRLTAEAQNKANNIREQIISNSITFEQAAEEYSQDTITSVRGGEIGWLTTNTMLPEIAAALRILQPGEISQPIQTILGYHLIRLNNLEDSQTLSENKLVNLSDSGAVNVSHILIKTFDFEAWLEKQKKQAHTIKLIPIKS